MGEIKISLSDKTEKIIQNISDSLGIKKTEFVKGIVIDALKKIKFKKEDI
ncbi:MAG: hypothetical protein AABW81_02495 [Nanoarchaeota archaeon]